MRLLFQTDRLRVVEMAASYLECLLELDSDPDVMRFINGGLPTSPEQMRDKLERWTADYRAAQPCGFWAAHLLEDDAFVGWVHLKPDPFEPTVDELGYRLARRFWGRGLATELASGMIRHAFDHLNRPTVVARTLLGNRASQRVMEKAGMRREFEFVYPPSLLPGWSEDRRAAVRYRIDTDWRVPEQN